MYSITVNPQFNSTEVTFDSKPSDAIRDVLKGLHFRWHHQKGLWYGRAAAEEVSAILEGLTAPEGKAKTKAAKSQKQDHIRIYWNGLKVDGGQLIKCYYSLDTDSQGVTIYSHSCIDLPRDIFEVKNDSDMYTDYFEDDRAYLTPSHPLFPYVLYAAMKQRARYEARHAEQIEEELNSGRKEPWPGRFDTLRKDLERCREIMAAFAAMKDPGQPTAEDLAKIDRQRTEEANAQAAAELAEAQAQREKALCLRLNGAALIREQLKAYPVAEGAPAVVINWSEHPAFYQWEDDALILSVAAAEKILGQLDAEQKAEDGGYFKTKFTLVGNGPDGEPISYTGRYDLGDGDGGLIQHIRTIAEWELTHEWNGKQKVHPDKTNDRLELANWLGQFVA